MKGSGKPPQTYAGPSLREMVFQKLDVVMDRLMDARLDGQLPEQVDIYQAQAYADALAIFTNPYSPNMDAIRAEAVERWEARNAE